MQCRMVGRPGKCLALCWALLPYLWMGKEALPLLKGFQNSSWDVFLTQCKYNHACSEEKAPVWGIQFMSCTSE